MNKYSHELSQIADWFAAHLDYNYQREPINDHWDWENILWSGDKIRWAHLEKYYHPKASILHLVIMPKFEYQAPIYGFDLIELGGNITGLFLDFTSTGASTIAATDHEFANPRPIPEWADFFSEHFVCCRPQQDEIGIAMDSLPRYNTLIKNTVKDEKSIDTSRESQLQYILGQRKNPQTRKMLQAHCGKAKADLFIDQVLFPLRGLL